MKKKKAYDTVYFAGRLSNREELRGKRMELREKGIEVTSRWLDFYNKFETTPDGHRKEFARMDINDMLEAEAIIVFEDGDGRTNGGRHVEFGFFLGLAYADKGYPCDIHVIGERMNVFHFLPEVNYYPTWEQFLEEVIL